MSPLNFFVGSSSSADHEASREDDEGARESSGSEDEQDLDVEDLLWAAQMDLIGHRHPQAVAKLQQAVGLYSSAACATLGNLLSRGLRGEHLSHSCPPDHPSPTLDDPVASGSNPKRPAVLRTMTTPATHAASHDDSIAAAKLFVKGLEFELAKPLEPIPARPVSDDSDAEDGAEGRWFSLERALDLIVGLTDSYRFGVLHPPAEDEPTPEDDPWGRGATIAHEMLVHPSITVPPPLSSSKSLPPVSTSPRTRSVSRSYAHPSTKLPPPTAVHHPHPHLSAATKLRITVTVHALYLLALQVWPADKSAAEGYWRDIISIGGSGVGTKEGEEVVERARRRVDGIHRKEGSDAAWHVAKQKNRGRKPKRGVTTGTVGVDALGGGDALADIWREKREKEAEWKMSASSGGGHSPPTVKVDLKGKGRATSTEEQPIHSYGNTSAITIRANGEDGHSRGPSSLSTSTVSASRTPRPSKFHFATDPPNDYPSPPNTPGHSPPQPLRSEAPHEGHGIVGVASFTNTIATEEPESYFPPQASTSPDTSISTHSLNNDDRRHTPSLHHKHSRTSLGGAFSPSSKLISRVRSSASVSTLPPDFGSTRPSEPWAREPTTAIGGISFEGALAESGPVGRPRAVSLAGSSLSAGANRSSSGWKSGWKQTLSSLRESSSRIIEGLTTPRSPPPPSAEEVLREMLAKDDESAGPGMMWASLEEEQLETEHEEEHSDEEDGERKQEQPEPSTSKLDSDRLAPPASPIASTSSSGRLSPKAPHPKLHRLNSASTLSTRSFVDVTSAEPRVPYHTSTNPPTPERSSRANSHRRVVSSPNLLGAPVDMDPLLLELERQSRVGVKTVCATCGKKGLNYPRARGGGTYCSRDCRVKGLKVQSSMERKGKEKEASSVKAAA